MEVFRQTPVYSEIAVQTDSTQRDVEPSTHSPPMVDAEAQGPTDQEEVAQRWEQVIAVIGSSANSRNRVTLHSEAVQTVISVGNARSIEPEVDPITADVIMTRLDAFAIMPDKAASDELDFLLDMFRPLVYPTSLVPCCWWDCDTQMIQVISNRQVSLSQEGAYNVLMLSHDHWFMVQATRSTTLMQVSAIGFPSNDPETFNRFLRAFLRAFARFTDIDMQHIRANSIARTCPWRMCGFQVLWDVLQSCGVHNMVQCDEAMRCLANFHDIPQIQNIISHAMNAWLLVTQDTLLIQVAFSRRVLFLQHLLMYGQDIPFMSGGGIEELWNPGRPLPKLSQHDMSELATFVRHHQPVEALCACHTRAVAVQVVLKQYVQDWHQYALITAKVVKPTVGMTIHRDYLDCAWPSCAHQKVRFVHVALSQQVWRTLGPEAVACLVEARLLWIDDKCIVDRGSS